MRVNKIHILSTRELDSSALAIAAAAGIEIEISAFILTRPAVSQLVKSRITAISHEKAVVVFTSVKAIESVWPCLENKNPDWDVYCMQGEGRQKISERLGANAIAGTGKNAAELAAIIAGRGNKEKIFFFSGNLRKDDLPARLKKEGIELEEMMVYETILCPHRMEKEYEGYIFFSPSAVKSFYINNLLSKDALIFAIGPTTANELKKYSDNTIISSEEPDASLLIRKLVAHYEGNPARR